MRVSTLPARWFGSFLLLIAGTVGCTQSSPASLTTPSAVSVGPSATAAGPSANYTADGTWRFVSTLGDDTEVLITDVHQLANGDLQFLDEDNSLVTLKRLSQGSGAVITYRIAATDSEGGLCDVRAMGTVLLDTTTDTITAHIRLKELGCDNQRGEVSVTGTKLS